MALNGGAAAAAANLRRRRRTTSAAGTSMLQFYADHDGPGGVLKISPNVALVISIGFIAFVAILHVLGKAVFRLK